MKKEEEKNNLNDNKKNNNESAKDEYVKKPSNEKNKINLDENTININASKSEMSDFVSIINQTAIQLPKSLTSIKNYFLNLDSKIRILNQRIGNSIKFDILPEIEDINDNKEEKIENNILKDDIFDNFEQDKKLYKPFNLFNNYQKFLNEKNKELSNSINESIINEIKKKLSQIKNEKIKIFNKFQNVINDVLKLKLNIDLIINKNKTNIEGIKLENNSNELIILQNYIIQFDKEYNLILQKLKTFNENIANFIYDIISKYFEIYTKYNEDIAKERIKRMNNIQKYKTNEENVFFDKVQKMNENLSNDIKKFILIKNNYKEAKDKKKNKTLFSHLEEAIKANNTYNFYLMDNFENEKENKNEDYNKEDLSTLKTVLNTLKKSEDSFEDDSLNKAFNILGNNSNRQKYINLCLHFVKYANSYSLSNKENNYKFFKYNNFNNFIFSNNLFNMISHNSTKSSITSKDKNGDFKENYKYYQILDNIINIGENSFIENKYMCSLLKDYYIIEDINTWEACFKCELISSIKANLNRKDKTINLKQDVINLFKNKIIISSYTNFDFIKDIGLDNYIQNYDKLTNNEKNNFNNYELPKIVHNSIKKYLFHMANYNVLNIDLLNFIKDINEDFPFIKDKYWSFYLNYYKSSLNSIKKQRFQSKLTNNKIKKKIKSIKQKKLNLNNDNIIIDNNNIDEQKKIILILKNVIIFLNNEEKRQLLHLNKKLNMFKYIYKNILYEKKLSIQKHVDVWKIVLKCYKMKHINYKDLCKNNKHVDYYKVIVDDTKRTFLRNKNQEESIKIMENILCCFSLSNASKIKYCQGMNFLAAFFYDLTNNEETSFLLFTSLVDNTKLSEIYDPKFELLNSYFYVLERLIFLYLPKLSEKLKEYQINIDCFASPYFITLFSNTYIINYNCMKFIMFIIDNFIFKGWRVIFTSILTLLKFKENEIITKNEDEVVNFLVNDMKKNELLLDENFDKFLEIYKSYNIKDELINNLQEEYNLENNIKKELNIFIVK